MLENKGREIIATIVDDILQGRPKNAREKTFDVLKDRTSDRIDELKKEYNSELFDKENT